MGKILNFDDFIIFDGAMGTMLQAFGMKAGDLPETYNILEPDVIEKIHTEYINAGAMVITTNTFGANRFKFSDTEFQLKDIIQKGVAIAKKAAGENFVALNIGPLGQLMEPYGNLSFEDAYDAFKEQVVIGAEAGADLILIETMSDTYEAKAAILACKENCDLPIICTMTFQENGRTLTGTDPLTMVNIMQNLGVSALGMNCSLGPEEMMPLVPHILEYAKVPVIIQANAGLPTLVNNETFFDITPSAFSSFVTQMAEQGATIFGGCCGTSPEHISALKESLKDLKPLKPKGKSISATSSSTRTEVLGNDVKIIGERINPTGKKLLKAALIKGDMDYILKEAINQKDKGAHILDVNVGLPEINERDLMVQAIKEIQGIVNLPLQIDSVVPEVIDAGARVCNGRPIINSVNGEDAIMDAIFPIVKKYGCLVIALTLDEKGIPETASQRLAIAEYIVAKAKTYGIPKEDIIIDCLVLTASAQQKEVKETINAVRLIKENLGVPTTLGVSNISFGLPARGILNRTFLATALGAGLDTPILNPMEEDMMSTVAAFNVLWNHDKDSKAYIHSYSGAATKAPIQNSSNNPTEKDLKKVVINGLKEESAIIVKELLQTMTGLEIVDNYLIPALDIVGEKYEVGEIFLPQLIQSAESVKKAFEVIKAHMIRTNSGEAPIEKGKIALATVKGDIHDIGKNIVKVLLENYGYDVYDLGKDVPIEKVVEMVQKENIPLVGLSALMTTTVKNMELTIQALREQCPECKIMVGGAVLTKSYAHMIGADFYAKDARESVNIANDILIKN
ncbi:MAG TPA: dihydropteroate synthase [Epulopiscium sp.]|nr:dihydropteroate synthase [Candidatus Epulonipiscium sp.]